jgi:hypothetical protein
VPELALSLLLFVFAANPTVLRSYEGCCANRLVLPPAFSTALAREFQLRPSLFLADIQRALAVQLLQGDLAPTADTEVLLEHVRKQGIRELAAMGYKYRNRKHAK